MAKIKHDRPSAVAATFILVNLLVFAEVKTIHGLPLNTSSSVEESRLSWDISTDNVAAYSLIPMLDLESLMEETAETEWNYSRRRRSTKVKNIVFEMVSSSERRSFPYQGAVRINDLHCSGTLISDSHVLTAAHCVHNGRMYSSVSRVRVGESF